MNDYQRWPRCVPQSHFIEAVYNRTRPHSAIGYRSPVEFEASLEQLKLP